MGCWLILFTDWSLNGIGVVCVYNQYVLFSSDLLLDRRCGVYVYMSPHWLTSYLTVGSRVNIFVKTSVFTWNMSNKQYFWCLSDADTIKMIPLMTHITVYLITGVLINHKVITSTFFRICEDYNYD